MWKPVADEMESRGRLVVIPSLLDVANSAAPHWQQIPPSVAASTTSVGGSVVLVGHSGAGPLLPSIANAMPLPVAAIIFVDSFLPPPAGAAELVRPELLPGLHARAQDGVLPPWAEWFGDEEMRQLVPDDKLRTSLIAEMPRMPLSYFEGVPVVPDGWDRRPCAYLLFSDEPYRASALEAEQRGWPVVVLPGAKHLHLVSHPAVVADSLLDLEIRLLSSW